MSSGGALSRAAAKPPPPQIVVPPPALGRDLAALLRDDAASADVRFMVEGEAMPAHKIILQVRASERGVCGGEGGGMRRRHLAARDVPAPAVRLPP